MDYDMWCLGNHEFNNDLPILKRQIEYVMSPDNGEEHSVPMSAANFVAKGTGVGFLDGRPLHRQGI